LPVADVTAKSIDNLMNLKGKTLKYDFFLVEDKKINSNIKKIPRSKNPKTNQLLGFLENLLLKNY
jgi:hypothetical protein